MIVHLQISINVLMTQFKVWRNYFQMHSFLTDVVDLEKFIRL